MLGTLRIAQPTNIGGRAQQAAVRCWARGTLAILGEPGRALIL